jgi:hypothetical protein
LHRYVAPWAGIAAMKTYLILTGASFGLIGIAHLLRLFFEEHPLSDPWFLGGNLALFVIGGGVAVWAARLLAGLRSHPPGDRSSGP